MKSENHTNRQGRRSFVRGAVGLGALAVGGVVSRACGPSGHAATDGSAPAAAPPHRVQAPAAGPPAAGARPPTYRLRPFAGETSMGAPAGNPAVRTHAVYFLEDGGGRIALTFDDGPDPVYTPQVLRILAQYNVQATFCVIGENAVQYPQLLHDIANGGHAVANHTWTHPQLTKLKPAAARSELERTSDLIEKVLGAPPDWARAPYGDWNPATLAVCADLGMEPLGWSLDTNDWARPGTNSITKSVLRDVKDGTIVLCHDGGGDRSQTVDAVRDYLPRLLDSGYVPVRPEL
ncbi:polysaccharide deacetylase family protein [Streptomyces sp. NBC_00859]|uniref:polysaccharide deacetylase family protein n=1 Tax=Streptomyces sp. NBC_00859 TaxID=2903682 RepID=UPI00386F4880|nr:polysaccharide deacetylase family protein [Streptomyces sp. NBC_00859]